jgi:hypothetical protein
LVPFLKTPFPGQILRSTGSYFLNRILSSKEIGTRIDKWASIKLKSFCTSKEKITRIKKQPTGWEKIFASYSTDKRLISKICKELKITHQKNNTINKWANKLNSL